MYMVNFTIYYGVLWRKCFNSYIYCRKRNFEFAYRVPVLASPPLPGRKWINCDLHNLLYKRSEFRCSLYTTLNRYDTRISAYYCRGWPMWFKWLVPEFFRISLCVYVISQSVTKVTKIIPHIVEVCEYVKSIRDLFPAFTHLHIGRRIMTYTNETVTEHWTAAQKEQYDMQQ